MERRRHFFNAHIAGLSFYDASLIFHDLKIGTKLDLDKFMEMGYTDIFDVRINRVNPNEDPESQIGISVHILPANG
ncbi:MAG: hypothetical protein CSB01_03515 [Bacteroidia bacterium]|nr:MAG: hypothetical protein CSB01_03515 [Bacteroidia bacterium]